MNEYQITIDEDFIKVKRKVRDYVGSWFLEARKEDKKIKKIILSPTYANILMVFCSDLVDSKEGMIPIMVYGVETEVKEDVNIVRIDFED